MNDNMFFKNWSYLCKQITSSDMNNECPISIETIKINEWYCKCNKCNHNISFVSFYKMVSINKYTIMCPICRWLWNNKIFYFNNGDNNNRTFMFCKKILQYKLKIHRNKHKIINYIYKKIDGISNYFVPPSRATNGYLQVIYDNEFVMDNDDLYSLNNLPNNLPNDIINKEEKKFWYCVFIFYIIIIFIMYLLI